MPATARRRRASRREIEGLPEGFDRAALQELLPAGAARNAVDCALWDLEAKRAGRRVWELAGLPAPGPEVTAYTLSLDAPEAMRAEAARNAGRPLLKVKLGGEGDMARLEAVRAGAPRARIIVDANEGWTAEAYAALAPALVRLGVELVEQPLPAGADAALAEMARPLPVCADESCHDRASLAGLAGKYDVVNVKLDKTGGLTEALALAGRGAGGGLRGDGGLHGRAVARHGAGGAGGAGGGVDRSRRAAAAGAGPGARAGLRRGGRASVHAGALGVAMSRIVYVNGAYVPEEEARISVFDRGFLFADAVYEVTSVLDGRLVDFAGHLARLHRSLGELEMAAPPRRRGDRGDAPGAGGAERGRRGDGLHAGDAGRGRPGLRLPGGAGARGSSPSPRRGRWSIRPGRGTGSG